MKHLLILLLTLITLSSSYWGNVTYDFSSLGQIPVLYSGRLQPFDSVARNGLILIREKSSLKRTTNEQKLSIPPTQWLFEVLCHNPAIFEDPIFLIHDPAIKHEFNLDDNIKYFSYNQLKSHQFKLYEKAAAYKDIESPSVYEKNILQLSSKIGLFTSFLHGFIPFDDLPFGDYLKRYQASVAKGLPLFHRYNQTGQLNTTTEELLLIEFNRFFKQHRQFTELSNLYLYPDPTNPSDSTLWANTGSELLKELGSDHTTGQVITYYGQLSTLFDQKNISEFNSTSKALLKHMQQELGFTQTRITFEYYFHQINPFYWAMVLYVVIFILMLFYYLLKKNILYKSATWLCYSAFSIHSLGLLARMFIQNRPPVTNLYSSAVFVGWFAIGLCLFLEKIFKNKLSNTLAAILGFITLIIAHHLALQGDTLEQMQAVLDSNFWLSTHVITITLGYSGTFLAGAIATLYIGFGLTKKLTAKLNLDLQKMVYAIICFSLFFSFIGTILGGIWADQSWGRFWGWDPKENGALLIVLWNALILHAKMAGHIQTKGVMLMSIFGNIVTAFAWFGVNMLGVGLHSYGFMDQMFNWLLLYVISQLALIIIGLKLNLNQETLPKK